MHLDAVAIKRLTVRLCFVKKKTPPTKVVNEVDHKAAEHSSTSRVVGKSNKKSG